MLLLSSRIKTRSDLFRSGRRYIRRTSTLSRFVDWQIAFLSSTQTPCTIYCTCYSTRTLIGRTSQCSVARRDIPQALLHVSSLYVDHRRRSSRKYYIHKQIILSCLLQEDLNAAACGENLWPVEPLLGSGGWIPRLCSSLARVPLWRGERHCRLNSTRATRTQPQPLSRRPASSYK